MDSPKTLVKTILWTTAMISIGVMASLAQVGCVSALYLYKKARGTC